MCTVFRISLNSEGMETFEYLGKPSMCDLESEELFADIRSVRDLELARKTLKNPSSSQEAKDNAAKILAVSGSATRKGSVSVIANPEKFGTAFQLSSPEKQRELVAALNMRDSLSSKHLAEIRAKREEYRILQRDRRAHKNLFGNPKDSATRAEGFRASVFDSLFDNSKAPEKTLKQAEKTRRSLSFSELSEEDAKKIAYFSDGDLVLLSISEAIQVLNPFTRQYQKMVRAFRVVSVKTPFGAETRLIEEPEMVSIDSLKIPSFTPISKIGIVRKNEESYKTVDDNLEPIWKKKRKESEEFPAQTPNAVSRSIRMGNRLPLSTTLGKKTGLGRGVAIQHYCGRCRSHTTQELVYRYGYGKMCLECDSKF